MSQFSMEATLGFHLITNVLSRELSEHVDRCAAIVGMSAAELMVLYVVRKLGEASAADIQRASACSPNEISGSWERLRKAELVSEAEQAGGRRVLVITSKGEKLLDRLSACQQVSAAVGRLHPQHLAERLIQALAGIVP